MWLHCWKFRPHAPIFGLVISTLERPSAKSISRDSFTSSRSEPDTWMASGMSCWRRLPSSLRWHHTRAGWPVLPTMAATCSQRSWTVRFFSARCSLRSVAGMANSIPSGGVDVSMRWSRSVSVGRMNRPSSKPRSEGLRHARAQLATQRQKGSSAWPLKRHLGASPYIRRLVQLLLSFLKNLASMSMWPM